MSKAQQFDHVWDALEQDPVRAENLRLRSALLIVVSQKIKSKGITQQQAASLLQISQPRVCALLQGKIERFRLDSLVDMAHRLGLSVQISIAV
jgi:predicted XRE-type DNA-binding protein